MSLTYQYLLVKGAILQLDAPEDISFAGSRHELPAWTAFINHAEDPLGLAELERLAAISSAAHDLTLGNYVETSDYGYCIGASDGRIDFRFVINPRGAEGLIEGRWALERYRSEAGSGAWKPSAVEHIQSWAARLGRTVSQEAILEILDTEWTYPEQGVRAFVNLLGIPDIDWHWVP